MLFDGIKRDWLIGKSSWRFRALPVRYGERQNAAICPV